MVCWALPWRWGRGSENLGRRNPSGRLVGLSWVGGCGLGACACVLPSGLHRARQTFLRLGVSRSWRVAASQFKNSSAGFAHHANLAVARARHGGQRGSGPRLARPASGHGQSPCLVVVTKLGKTLALHKCTEEVEASRHRVTSFRVRVGYATTLRKIQGAALPHVTIWLDLQTSFLH